MSMKATLGKPMVGMLLLYLIEALIGTTTFFLPNSTNSGIYPKSWENPAVYKYLFYPSATKCCEGYFGVDHESLCTVVNACSDDSDSDETISKLDIVQATPKPSFAKTSRPTKPPLTRNPSKPPVTRSPSKPPTTRHPTKPPLTRSPTSSPMKAETEPEETGTAENSTPSMDSSCGANGFHVSLTAGEKITCRNDDNHPSAWLEEGVKDSFMFASGAACCEVSCQCMNNGLRWSDRF